MNKTLKDVARVLYEVNDLPCCEVCFRRKEKEDNQPLSCVDCTEKWLSCVDCIEKWLQKLINRATPKKPVLYELCDEGDNDYVFYEIDSYTCCQNCKQQNIYDCEYGERFKHCSNCGQAIDWSNE